MTALCKWSGLSQLHSLFQKQNTQDFSRCSVKNYFQMHVAYLS